MLMGSIPCMEIGINKSTDAALSVSYPDQHLEIDIEDWLRTELYTKRDYFNFRIVNFPFMFSNISTTPTY